MGGWARASRESKCSFWQAEEEETAHLALLWALVVCVGGSGESEKRSRRREKWS